MSEDRTEVLGQPSESLLKLTADYCIQGHLFAYGNRRFTEGKEQGRELERQAIGEWLENHAGVTFDQQADSSKFDEAIENLKQGKPIGDKQGG